MFLHLFLKCALLYCHSFIHSVTVKARDTKVNPTEKVQSAKRPLSQVYNLLFQTASCSVDKPY